MTPKRKQELREFFATNLFANEILDALDVSEEAHVDAVRMVGALVVETDEETQERAKARYAASPGAVHDLVTMAQQVERYRARDAALRKVVKRLKLRLHAHEPQPPVTEADEAWLRAVIDEHYPELLDRENTP